MSSEDLSLSLKGLTLGPSQDVKDAEIGSVNKQSIGARKRKLKSKKERQIPGPANDKPSEIPIKLPEKLDVETATPSGTDSAITHPISSPSPTKKGRRPRNRKGKHIEPQTQPVSKEGVSAKQQVRPTPQASESPQRTFAYVVEVAEPYEKILGVFTSLSKAQEKVEEHAAHCGIPRSDIKDIVSSFGWGGSSKLANARATRRTWPNGMSEVRVLGSSQLRWLKVLPKEVAPTDESHSPDLGPVAYLALDASSGGLFVIGVYRSKEGAWEACRKYWTQLSYCSSIENWEQSLDAEGMLHAKGVLGGQFHHWFVKQFTFDDGERSGGGGQIKSARSKTAKTTKAE